MVSVILYVSGARWAWEWTLSLMSPSHWWGIDLPGKTGAIVNHDLLATGLRPGGMLCGAREAFWRLVAAIPGAATAGAGGGGSGGVCAILLRLYTSTERLKRVYTSPGPNL